jgi:signal transduction protein with GAF and PtsI domain
MTDDARSRLDRALDEAIMAVGADSGTIHLKEPGRSMLYLAASRGIPEFVLQAVQQIPWGKGMAGVAAERVAPVTYCNLHESKAPEIHPKARNAGVLGAIVVPMMSGKQVVGTLGIGCKKERTFTAAEISWLMRFGRELAGEIGDQRMAA